MYRRISKPIKLKEHIIMKSLKLFLLTILIVLSACITQNSEKKSLRKEGLFFNRETFLAAIKYNEYYEVKTFLLAGMKTKPSDTLLTKSTKMKKLLMKYDALQNGVNINLDSRTNIK